MLKKSILSVLFCTVIFAASMYAQVTTTAIPDLEGKYPPNSVSAESGRAVNQSILYKNPADFPVFSGFPALGSYQSFSPKNGAIAVNMDADSDLEIVFGTGDQLMALNPNGSTVPGWPKTYDLNWEAVYAPSFGDIDGDGQGEIVVSNGGALGGKIYAYKKDGTLCTGFPITTGKYPMTPVLADVDNDGKMEIIIGNRTSQVHVYKGDGTIAAGWPVTMNKYVGADCAVGDINNDGKKEIIAESSTRLYAWSSDGKIVPGFPYILPDTVNGSTSYSAPVLVDLDKNGKKQIVFCSHASDPLNGGTIHVVNPDGTAYKGWPKSGFGSNWIYATPAIADLDNDGYPDIIVPEYASGSEPAALLYAFKRDGKAVSGFPQGPFWGMANQITVADIDNDGKVELIADQNVQYGDYGQYIAVHVDTSSVANWPVNVLRNTGFQQPVLTDLNGDGKLDIVGGGFEFNLPHAVYLYALNTGLKYNANNYINPVFQFNVQHDGVYPGSSPSVPVELSSFNAVNKGSDVIVKWETATETNNAYFELFRDANSIAKIDGNGTTSARNSYTYNDKNLAIGTYTYKLVQHDFDGTSKSVGTVQVNVSAPVSFALNQNYPNPFNPSTIISYSLLNESKVKLNVYNSLGQKVKELVNKNELSGVHQVVFNASNLPSGAYTYSLEVISNSGSSFFASKKMILAK